MSSDRFGVEASHTSVLIAFDRTIACLRAPPRRDSSDSRRRRHRLPRVRPRSVPLHRAHAEKKYSLLFSFFLFLACRPPIPPLGCLFSRLVFLLFCLNQTAITQNEESGESRCVQLSREWHGCLFGVILPPACRGIFLLIPGKRRLG